MDSHENILMFCIYVIKMHIGKIFVFSLFGAGPQPVSNFVVNIVLQNDEVNVSGNGDDNCFMSAVLQKCGVSE